ncbi:FAD-dependent 5-carboxymethylaminomethyl-2-thiouridine(34) oxidoreductase MnmC [Methylibium sp.]|uniref:FAD-dependent 5-carboxymethylaminomethyl-2-thiouridine(34) oxidoreductase MnmC n=1 Tax=Methylibium sp. TaxID=2067992 RepID=UPI003D0DC302
MRTEPITPGRLAFTPDGVPLAPDFGDVYHPAAGALVQARHVFLGGNRLPGRWAGRERFVILETGFGLGNNFLATWNAWREDPQRCERLVFVAIEKHPLTHEDLSRAHAASPLPALAAALLAAWPLATPNLHPLAFEAGRVQLLLGFGDVARLLPQLVGAVDAFFLDGFAPARNPDMWEPRRLQRLGRLAAPGATAATWSAARTVRDGLSAAGFTVEAAAGTGGKRDITVARFTPRHTATAPPGGWHAHGGPREALVIGAGLAGCAAAWALSLQGWHCRVLDREAHPAAATSGNPAGLFHGSFHRDDGPHARAHRAAALLTQRVAGEWIELGRVTGQLAGCLRLESRLADAAARAALARQQMARGYVDWLDREAASACAGLALPSGAWHYPGGGWLAPRRYANELLARSGALFTGGVDVARIERILGVWRALDAHDRVIAAAPVLVLANGLGTKRLLGPAGGDALASLSAVRGQISSLCANTPGLPRPRLPVAGGGYVLPPIDGQLIFGATSQPADDEPALREADHRLNLTQLAGLSGGDADAWAALPWQGRVGWRAVTNDRLPLIGAVPDADALAQASRADQPRFVPRQRDAQGGLYVFTGLGSRGITWAALGGQLLASWISGTPCPLEADLRDALDPARYTLRRWRSDS